MLLQGTKNAIDVDQILFLKSHLNYTEFFLLNQKNQMFSYTLQRYEEKLQSYNFKRVHRSYLVNLDHVVSKEFNRLIMSNGTLVPMSRRKKI